jgi:hypothetical protein
MLQSSAACLFGIKNQSIFWSTAITAKFVDLAKIEHAWQTPVPSGSWHQAIRPTAWSGYLLN